MMSLGDGKSRDLQSFCQSLKAQACHTAKLWTEELCRMGLQFSLVYSDNLRTPAGVFQEVWILTLKGMVAPISSTFLLEENKEERVLLRMRLF